MHAWLLEIADRCDPEVLKQCYALIAESIDVDLSSQSKQTCIREGFNLVRGPLSGFYFAFC